MTLGICLLILEGYYFVNDNLDHKVDLALPLDSMIPYWPWTSFFYFSLYFMYLTVAVKVDSQRYTQLLLDIVMMTMISFICFALITSHYPRPDPSEWAHSIWKPIIDHMVKVDSPGNTCPSLHVSTSIYISLTMRFSPRARLWMIWGVLVSLSTLTMKQHFVWDWVGGVILASLVIFIQPWTGRWIKSLRDHGIDESVSSENSPHA